MLFRSPCTHLQRTMPATPGARFPSGRLRAATSLGAAGYLPPSGGARGTTVSYYLFSRRELAAKLSAAGFALEVLESDSILPERRLIRSPALPTVDDILRRLIPAWAGYGLRATIRAGSR